MKKITEYLESLDATSKTKAELLYNSELELHSKSEKMLEIAGENDVARRKYRPLVLASSFGLLLIPALSEKGFHSTIITVSAIILFLIPIIIALKTMVLPKSFREEFKLSKEVHRRRKNILKIVNNNWKDPIWKEVKKIMYSG